jgi:excisionase family DNA binding protein
MTSIDLLPKKAMYRPDELADYLDKSRQTIYRWIEEGKLKAVKDPGGCFRITRETVIHIFATSE